MHVKRPFLVVIATALCLAALVPSVSATTRSGDLHVTKDCVDYQGAVGEHCTILTSNLKAIPTGAPIYYAQALVYPLLNSDVALVAGPGNRAVGHCNLDLSTGVGRCTFLGGTGQFTHFHADVLVSYLGGTDWAWDGWYSFDPGD